MAELTGLLRHSVGGDRYRDWPVDMRIIVRREPIPLGKQVSLFEQHDGHRYQVIATNTAGGQLQRLEARHAGPDRARVESGIRTAKDTGLARVALEAVRDQHARGATPSRSPPTCSPGPGS